MCVMLGWEKGEKEGRERWNKVISTSMFLVPVVLVENPPVQLELKKIITSLLL